MTFASFSPDGRGAGWEIGENLRRKKPLSPLPSALFQAGIGDEQGHAQFLADKIEPVIAITFLLPAGYRDEPVVTPGYFGYSESSMGGTVRLQHP